jgi:hypothetical protein
MYIIILYILFMLVSFANSEHYAKKLRKLDSCYEKLNIITIPSLYIYRCAMFRRKHEHPEYFITNKDIHKI